MNKRIIVAVLAILLTASASAQTTNFFDLVKTGSPQAVQAAIANGADVNARDNDGVTALMYAAESNQNPDVVATLLKAGADILAKDSKPHWGGTALLWAAVGNKNPKVITVLLKAGADINVRNVDGKTALIWAVMENPNPEVVMTLLNAGADAKVKYDDYTALDFAQMNRTLNGTSALKKLEEASK